MNTTFTGLDRAKNPGREVAFEGKGLHQGNWDEEKMAADIEGKGVTILPTLSSTAPRDPARKLFLLVGGRAQEGGSSTQMGTHRPLWVYHTSTWTCGTMSDVTQLVAERGFQQNSRIPSPVQIPLIFICLGFFFKLSLKFSSALSSIGISLILLV